MLAMIDEYGKLPIAGIIECRVALALVERGEIVIVPGSKITPDGGSGCIRRPEVCDLHGVPEDNCACNNP